MTAVARKPPVVGCRAGAVEARNVAPFLLIASGRSGSWWAPLVFDVLAVPAGIGTDTVEADPMILLLAVTPFGPLTAGFVVAAMTEGRLGVRSLCHPRGERSRGRCVTRFWSH